MRVNILKVKNGLDRLYVIKDEQGVTFIIVSDKQNNAGFFILEKAYQPIFMINLGIPTQGFSAPGNHIILNLDQEKNGTRRIVITNPKDKEIGIDLTPSMLQELKTFLLATGEEYMKGFKFEDLPATLYVFKEEADGIYTYIITCVKSNTAAYFYLEEEEVIALAKTLPLEWPDDSDPLISKSTEISKFELLTTDVESPKGKHAFSIAIKQHHERSYVDLTRPESIELATFSTE